MLENRISYFRESESINSRGRRRVPPSLPDKNFENTFGHMSDFIQTFLQMTSVRLNY